MRSPELTGSVVDQRADALSALGLEHAYADPGVKRPESADQLGHRIDCQCRQRRDLEGAGVQVAHPGDRRPGLVHRAQDLARWADERLARRR